MNRALVYLYSILEDINLAEQFEADLNKDIEDIKSLKALERVLETLSDATSKIPLEWKEQYPKIEWNRIKSFRNYIAHDYLSVDTHIILQIMQRNIPELKSVIEDMLNKYGN